MGEGTVAMEKLLLERLETLMDKQKKLTFRGLLNKIRESLKSKLDQLGDGDGKVVEINERDTIREHLFLLNNLTIEARMIPTHYRGVTSDYYRVRAAIKQLKVEVDVDVKKTSGSPARIQNHSENVVSTPTATDTIPRVTSAPARMQNAVEGQKTKSELDWEVDRVRRWSKLSLPKVIRGFESDELAMENLLLYHRSSSSDAEEEAEEADFNAVGIVGAEGVGKTTLAWKVLNRPLIAKAFLPRILINDIDVVNNGMGSNGSENVIHKKIVIARRILSALGVESDEPRRPNNNNTSTIPSANLELAALICAIRSELKGKRYLVVLDGVSSLDVWEVDKEEKQLAESLWFAFPRGSGGAVVVTGRDTKETRKDNLVTEIVRRARGDRRVPRTVTTPTPRTVTTPTPTTETTPTPTPETETAPTPASERGDYDEKRKIYRLIPLDNPNVCWDIYKDEIGEEEDVDKDLLELRNGMTDKEKDGEDAVTKDGDVDKEQPESGKDDRAKRMTVKDEVIQKCKGYPMAARMMAVVRKDQLEEKKRENERKIKAQQQEEEEEAKKNDQHHSTANPGTTASGGGGGGGDNTTTSGGGGEIQEHDIFHKQHPESKQLQQIMELESMLCSQGNTKNRTE